MIKTLGSPHEGEMSQDGLPIRSSSPTAGPERVSEDFAPGPRMKEMVEAHHDLIWRFLRRLGVHHGDVDDGAQRVFLVAAAGGARGSNESSR